MAVESVSNEIGTAEDEAVFQQVMCCEPAIKPEQVEKLADLVVSNEFVGRPWRLTAVLAGKNGAFFKNLSEDQKAARTFAQAIQPLSDFVDLCREMADLAECVKLRLAVAGCAHEQFVEWMKEAEN